MEYIMAFTILNVITVVLNIVCIITAAIKDKPDKPETPKSGYNAITEVADRDHDAVKQLTFLLEYGVTPEVAKSAVGLINRQTLEKGSCEKLNLTLNRLMQYAANHSSDHRRREEP